jgi:hypothetical protein
VEESCIRETPFLTLGFTHLAQYFDRRLAATISRLGVQV